MAWVDDDFTGNNGDAPNSTKWTETDANDKLSIQDNALEFDSADANDRDAYIDSTYYVTGDFDLQIDVEELNGVDPSTSSSHTRLQVSTDGGIYIFLYMGRNSTGKVFNANSLSTSSTTIGRSIDNTKLRLTRSGTTIKGYYWSGSQWEWNGNTDGFTFSESTTDNVTVKIYCKQEGTGLARWNTAVDNFVVNSGGLSPDILVEDFSLNLAAYYQKIEYLKMVLQAHDGVELRDFQVLLDAHDGVELRDFQMILQAIGSLDVFTIDGGIIWGEPENPEEWGGGTALTVYGNTYIGVLDESFLFIDIAILGDPTYVGKSAQDTTYLYTVKGVIKEQQILYGIARGPSGEAGALFIYDLTDAPSATLMAGIVSNAPSGEYNFHNVHSMIKNGDYIYTHGYAITTTDVSDPTDPQVVDTRSWDDEYFDELPHSLNSASGASGCITEDGYFYSPTLYGLAVWDVFTDPAYPDYVTKFGPDWNGTYYFGAAGDYFWDMDALVRKGDYIFVLSNGGVTPNYSTKNAFVVYDISGRPGTCTRVFTSEDEGNPYAHPAFRGLALCGDDYLFILRTTSLEVWNISNPTAPAILEAIDIPYTYSMYVQEDKGRIVMKGNVVTPEEDVRSGIYFVNISKYAGVSPYQAAFNFKMLLEVLAEDPSVFNDLIMILEAVGEKKESLSMLLQGVKDIYNNFQMLLETTDGNILKDFMLMLQASDGTVLNDFALHLQALKATPVFRSVTAHRVSSVIHEVSI